MIHLRGAAQTACGIDMYTKGYNPVTTVASVGDHRIPGHPVTCPDCLAWIKTNWPAIA